jgi:uncharacterized repeat protein (TIGR03803 family)
MPYEKSTWQRARALALLGAMTGIAAHAQDFTTLVNFDGANGGYPSGYLVQGINGDFYGTTSDFGLSDFGTIFRMTPQGQLKSVYNFGATDGVSYAGLMATSNGMLYGTSAGGANGDGAIFQITPGGTLTMLDSFDGTNGANPQGGLVQAFNGMLWGATLGDGEYGGGTIFQITPSGTLTTVHSFGANNHSYPPRYPSGLIQASNAMLYGTTQVGGRYNYGTIYAISIGGAVTALYDFDFTDGSTPSYALVQGADGNFYGTTPFGGSNHYGTVFRITSTGTLTTLHSFDGTDGSSPRGGLVQGTDGNFYGTTSQGGSGNHGTIFQITPAGTLSTVHSFVYTDGSYPGGALVQGTDGSFYGTTADGGSNKVGTVFRLSMGLGPFVRTLPAFGKVAAAVTILGSALTGATSVTFNGTAAAFTVVSTTQISTSVPAGAGSGKAQVVTPGGTLSSNVPFLVQ